LAALRRGLDSERELLAVVAGAKGLVTASTTLREAPPSGRLVGVCLRGYRVSFQSMANTRSASSSGVLAAAGSMSPQAMAISSCA
jgi:hypothetical protein